MRSYLIIIFTIISFNSIGQKIEFRNDSLFINSFYVNAYTPKLTLDSLLNATGKEKKNKGKHKPGSKEIMNWTRYTYNKEGLIFSKNDYDTAMLSVSVKLYRNSNDEVDYNNMPTKPFKGELYIADNFMNDKRTIEQLQKLNNCTLEYHQFQMKISGQPKIFTNANLIYQKSSINILFDVVTAQTTCIFIHTNWNTK